MFGAYLAKLGSGGDKKVTINFGVQDHCYWGVEDSQIPDQESLSRLDTLTFNKFTVGNLEAVFDNMKEFENHSVLDDYDGSMFFEGYSVHENGNEVTVTLRWGT